MWWRSLGLYHINASVVALILLTIISFGWLLFAVVASRFRHVILYAVIGLVFVYWIFSTTRC